MTNISIAMATYNGAKYLRAQLDSLYSQTKVPDEIVVCDDCSSDDTIKILEEFHKNKGLKYLINDTNLGVNKNFEKAIRACSSDYIAICDQDDVWFPQKIEILLKKIIEVENNQPCVISSRSTELKPGMSTNEYKCGSDSDGIYATLLGPSYLVQGCTLIMNKKMINLLKPFPYSYKEIMMYDGYISFVAATCGIKYNLAKVLMAYRRHESNVIGKISDKKNLWHRIVTKIKHLKFDRIFPSSRCNTLKYVYDEYCDVMHNEAKELIKKIIAYGNKGLLYRLNFILTVKYFDLSFKIKNIITELIMFLIPIKK